MQLEFENTGTQAGDELTIRLIADGPPRTVLAERVLHPPLSFDENALTVIYLCPDKNIILDLQDLLAAPRADA